MAEPLTLTAEVQEILNEGALRVRQAADEANRRIKAAQDAQQIAQRVANEAEGAYAAVMKMLGLNPQAHRATWDEASERVIVTPHADAEPSASSNIVALPTPKDTPTGGDA